MAGNILFLALAIVLIVVYFINKNKTFYHWYLFCYGVIISFVEKTEVARGTGNPDFNSNIQILVLPTGRKLGRDS